MGKALSSMWDVRGLGMSRAKDPIISCDLTGENAACEQIQAFQPHVVIHLASERREEILVKPQGDLLNVNATGKIAAACAKQLYGPVEYPEESAISALYANLESGATQKLDG